MHAFGTEEEREPIEQFTWHAELETLEEVAVPMYFRQEDVPVITVGDWSLGPEQADLFRQDAGQWLAGALQYFFESRRNELGDDHPIVKALPQNLLVYERLQTSRIDRECPIAQLHVDWTASPSKMLRWEVEEWSRQWVDVVEEGLRSSQKDEPEVDRLSELFFQQGDEEALSPVDRQAAVSSGNAVKENVSSFPVTAVNVKKSLERVFEKQKALHVLTDVCEQIGIDLEQISRSCPSLANHKVREAVRALKEHQDSIAHIVGKSLGIKIKVYEELEYGDVPPASTEADKIRNANRIKEIARLDFLSDRFQGLLNAQARDAARLCSVPTGFVSPVLGEAQYMSGKHGPRPEWMDRTEGVPVEWSSCKEVVKREKPVAVEHALKNERTKDNPLAENEGVQSYLGVPLRTSKGHVIGALSAACSRPRSFSEKEITQMRSLASKTMDMIEKRCD